MKKVLFFSAMVTAMAFTSCKTTTRTATSVKPDVWVNCAAEADLDIKKERVSITLSGSDVKCYTLNQIKENAAAKALESAHADVLLDPQYVVVKKLTGIKSVTVSGIPAKYINLRSVKPSK